MSIVINDLSLDVSKEKRVRPLTAKQYDINSRFLRVRITNEGAPVAVDSDAYVIINAARSDGKSKSFRGIVNDDGTVTVPVTGWMLESKDFIMCDISVIDGDTGSKLSTMSFEIDVEKASASNKCIQKDEKYDILVSLISDCKQAKDDCEEATVEAKAAAEKANTAADEAIKAKTETETATKNANDAAQGANTAAKNATDAACAAITAKQDADNAARGANTAAQIATDAASAAITAKQDADNAADNANTAARSANDAASAALTSKQGADTAAESANAAAAGASAAADRANDSADRAGEAADKADTAAESVNEAISKAETATESANTAAQRADTAAEQAEHVDISAVQTATGADITVTNRDGEETTVHIDTLFAVDGWLNVRSVVRLGLGEKLFPVGYGFETLDSDTGATIVWVVRGHDHHIAVNGSLEHTMTLEMKYVYSNANGGQKTVQFDAPEALYYAENRLEAGTYNFTWNYATGQMVNGTYQFALEQDIPAGGQIVLGTNSSSRAITDCKISTYASAGATEKIESDIVVTEGSEGTSLGTLSATASTDKNLNCAQRVMWGSNNYAQSAARQWLNSSAAAGSVWTPTNGFDRAPSWAATYNGFMHGLPADFLEAVQTAEIPCRTNSNYETASFDGTEFSANQVYSLKDKFFLLSRPEIYGSWDSANVKDGELLEYYDGLTNTERIKRDAGAAARNSWLRSPNPGTATNVRNVNTSGDLHSSNANNAYAVAAACIIA